MSIECSICLEEINDDSSSSLECNHVFHDYCIEEWAKVSRKSRNENIEWVCPLCRFTVSSLPDENDMVNDTNIRYLTLIKFKADRKFIQIVTFTDIIF